MPGIIAHQIPALSTKSLACHGAKPAGAISAISAIGCICRQIANHDSAETATSAATMTMRSRQDSASAEAVAADLSEKRPGSV
jgi:hypothetical protein